MSRISEVMKKQMPAVLWGFICVLLCIDMIWVQLIPKSIHKWAWFWLLAFVLFTYYALIKAHSKAVEEAKKEAESLQLHYGTETASLVIFMAAATSALAVDYTGLRLEGAPLLGVGSIWFEVLWHMLVFVAIGAAAHAASYLISAVYSHWRPSSMPK